MRKAEEKLVADGKLPSKSVATLFNKIQSASKEFSARKAYLMESKGRSLGN